MFATSEDKFLEIVRFKMPYDSVHWGKIDYDVSMVLDKEQLFARV